MLVCILTILFISRSHSEAPPITGGTVKKPRLEPPPGMCMFLVQSVGVLFDKGCLERVGGEVLYKPTLGSCRAEKVSFLGMQMHHTNCMVHKTWDLKVFRLRAVNTEGGNKNWQLSGQFSEHCQFWSVTAPGWSSDISLLHTNMRNNNGLTCTPPALPYN